MVGEVGGIELFHEPRPDMSRGAARQEWFKKKLKKAKLSTAVPTSRARRETTIATYAAVQPEGLQSAIHTFLRPLSFLVSRCILVARRLPQPSVSVAGLCFSRPVRALAQSGQG